ncbi:MAG: hypothetical protein ACRDQJ_20855, partial [Pseudonocardiaceae bacterium]
VISLVTLTKVTDEAVHVTLSGADEGCQRRAIPCTSRYRERRGLRIIRSGVTHMDRLTKTFREP